MRTAQPCFKARTHLGARIGVIASFLPLLFWPDFTFRDRCAADLAGADHIAVDLYVGLDVIFLGLKGGDSLGHRGIVVFNQLLQVVISTAS